MDPQNQQQRHHQGGGGKAILGLVLVILGLLLIGNQFDLIPGNLRHVIFTWQSLLILIGILFLTRRDNKATGFILIFIGGFFLIPDIFNVPYEWRRLFWPVIFIVIGITLIFGTAYRFRRSSVNQEGTDDDYIDDVNVFGGHDRIITAKTFRGGSIVSVFGGGKYDLRRAELAPGNNVLEMTNVFGGSKLIVPSDWDIKIEVLAIFGGFSDKRLVTAISPDKRLVIKGSTVFGGGEVTSI